MPKFLSDEHERVLRTEQANYTIEDGVVLDPTDFAPRPDSRQFHEREYALLDSFPNRVRQQAEEIEWAKRSGPVFYIKRAVANAAV